MSQELTNFYNAVLNEDCKRVVLQANATSTVAGADYVIPYSGTWVFTAYGTLDTAKPAIQKKKGANYPILVDEKTGLNSEITASGNEFSVLLNEGDTVRGASSIVGGASNYTSELVYNGR